MLRFYIILLVVAFVIALVAAAVNNFNSVVLQEVTNLKRELRCDEDSIKVIEVKHKELYRIQQLSFKSPVTPEHVKGVELDSLNMRLMRLDNWLSVKKAEVKAKEKMAVEMSSYCINLDLFVK